jgi:hypothetical protein
MQFTTGLLTLALAAAGVAAAPGALQERQDTVGLFFIQYFTEANCQGTMIDSNTWVDVNESSNTCQAAPARVANYPSFRVRNTDGMTRPIFLLESSDCSTEKGQAPLVVQPNTPIFTCFSQKVGSGFFGDA